MLPPVTTFSETINDNSLFPDVKPEHWAYERINEMTKTGLLRGYPDGTFRPDRKVTRAEFATILSRALLSENFTKEIWDINHVDVQPNHWAYKFIETASPYYTSYYCEVEKTSYFHPDEPALRQDVAAVSVRVLGMENFNVSTNILSSYSDSEEIEPAIKNLVAIASYSGIMIGKGDYFAPIVPLTRAEASVMILRYLESKNKGIDIDIEVKEIDEVLSTPVNDILSILGIQYEWNDLLGELKIYKGDEVFELYDGTIKYSRGTEYYMLENILCKIVDGKLYTSLRFIAEVLELGVEIGLDETGGYIVTTKYMPFGQN